MNYTRILHLEDNPIDAELIELKLVKKGLECEVLAVATASEYLVAIEQGGFDLILCDNGVPGFSGRAAFEIASQKCPQIPFIFLSGHINETEATAYLNAGAVDCICKDELWRLGPIIRRCVVQKTVARQFSSNQERYIQGMELLVKVVQQLSLVRSLDEIIAIVRIAARELTGADGATFVLREGDYCHYADENAIAPLWKGKRFPMSICLGGWCMLNKQQVIIEDIYGDERVPAAAYEPTFIKSLVMVPIRTAAPIGAIGNYWASQHLATPEEVSLIQALADTTSVAMENVQVYQELEQRVKDRTIQLEAANKELETFAYTVSHDLRSPLSAIKGYNEILQHEYGSQLDSEANHFMSRIDVSTERMSALIDQMLALHKLTQVEIQPQTVNLSRIAGDILASLKVNDLKRQVTTVIDPELTVYGDPILLRTVMENLLTNAWKYSSKRELARIEFGMAEESNDNLTLYVRDNGAGFNLSRAEKLFHPFARMHSASDFPGTGVGLASVQRIIHKHGGRIWAEAEVDVGATFYFTLPKKVLSAE